MSGGEKSGRAQVRWTKEMNRVLIDTLTEQIAAGNKGDNGWKSVAFQAVRTNMKSKLDKDVTNENVRNRLKTWKADHAALSFLLARSGWGRNPTNNKLTAPESVWKDFLKDNPQYGRYRDKSLDEYDEIGTIVGNDQATGSEAQTAADVENHIIDDETIPDLSSSEPVNFEEPFYAPANNVEVTGGESSPSCNVTPSTTTTKELVNKRKRKNRADAACKKESLSQMADGITSIANHMVQRDKKPDMDVLFATLRALKHITPAMRVKLVEYLVNDATKSAMFFMMDKEEQLEWCAIKFPEPGEWN